MSYNETLSMNVILAFQSMSSGLYAWKFKGKQIMTDLINCLTQYRILLTPKILNSEIASQRQLYSNAKKKCLSQTFKNLVCFESHLQKYSQALENLQKLDKQSQLQKGFLLKRLQDFKGSQKQKEYDFLILQLLELVVELVNQYKSHYRLMLGQHNQIMKKLMTDTKSRSSQDGQFSGDYFFSIPIDTLNFCINKLQVNLMTVQYQTEINNQNRDRFTETLSKISNKRGQLNK